MLMLCSPGLCGAKKSNPVQRDRDGDDLLLMQLARVHKNPFFRREMVDVDVDDDLLDDVDDDLLK